MTPSCPMEKLIETLLENAPPEAKESFPAQIHFRDGRFIAGQVSRAVFQEDDVIEGMYRLHTVAKTKQNGTEDTIMVVMFFAADAVLHLDIPLDPPQIATPSVGGLWVPGRE